MYVVDEAASAFKESDLEPEEDVDTELENLGSQALKEHTVRMHQQQRMSFSGQVRQGGLISSG